MGECLAAKCPGEHRDPMQVYKSLHAAVMTCDILVNTHTHMHTSHTDRQLLNSYTISSGS